MSDVFSNPDNEVKANFWKPAKVGDSAQGYYIKRKVWPNRLKGEGAQQVVYTLKQDDGSVILVAGRQGNPAVISGLESVKLGTKVGVKFVEEKPHHQAGYNAIKIIKAFADPKDVRTDLISDGFEDLQEVSEVEAPPFAD